MTYIAAKVYIDLLYLYLPRYPPSSHHIRYRYTHIRGDMKLDDILGEKQSRILLDEIEYLIEQIKIIGWKEIKPWNEFVHGFKLPTLKYKHVEQRILTNLLHYRSNYLFICVVVMLLQLIFHPIAMFSIIMVSFLSFYVLIVMKQPIMISDVILSYKHKQILTSLVSIIILVITGALTAITWTIIYCIAICGLHMLFRPRSITSKANKAYEEIKLSGWFAGGSSNSSLHENAHIDPEIGNNDYNNDKLRKRSQPLQQSAVNTSNPTYTSSNVNTVAYTVTTSDNHGFPVPVRSTVTSNSNALGNTGRKKE